MHDDTATLREALAGCAVVMQFCLDTERGECCADVQAEHELNWRPDFGLYEGLKDSYEKDFGRGTFRKEADFSTDDQILAKA